MLAQVGDVGLAAQEPQQLVDDRAQVQLLGGDQRKALRQVEAHLPAEHAAGAGAGAVGFFAAVLEHVLQQVEVLLHRREVVSGIDRERLRLQRRRTERPPQAIQAEGDHRQFQHLPHRQPAEGEVTQLRVRHADELDREPEGSVHQREQRRHAITRARRARIQPQHHEHHQAFEAVFVQRRWMARVLVEGTGCIGGLQLHRANPRARARSERSRPNRRAVTCPTARH